MQPLNLKSDFLSTEHLGLVSYSDAREYIRNVIHPQVRGRKSVSLVFAEHTPVLTLGKRLSLKDIPLQMLRMCEEREIEIVQTDRGGQLTYHGEGQLMIYPVLDLKAFRLTVKSFAGLVLESVSAVCRNLGLQSFPDSGLQGVWTGEGDMRRKIASCGFRILNGLSDHGVSVYIGEINDEFSFFSPCGMSSSVLTSFSRELGDSFNSDIVSRAFFTLFPVFFLSGVNPDTSSEYGGFYERCYG